MYTVGAVTSKSPDGIGNLSLQPHVVSLLFSTITQVLHLLNHMTKERLQDNMTSHQQVLQPNFMQDYDHQQGKTAHTTVQDPGGRPQS